MKSKISYFIYLAALFNCHTTFGQKQAIEIHIMPTSLIDYSPRLRFGVTYSPNEIWNYSLDYGIGNDAINHYRLDELEWSDQYHLYEFRPEVKYYYFRTHYRVQLYLAAECFYIHIKDHFQDDYYYAADANEATTYTQATFRKQKYGFHIKNGLRLIAMRKFNFDFYGGIGIAYRDISYTNVIGSNITYEEDEEWWPTNYKDEGSAILFHVTLGFKIGFTL